MTRSTTSPKPAGRPRSRPPEGDRRAEDFLRRSEAAFQTARQNAGLERLDVLIAGRRVAIEFAGRPLAEALAPALSHLADESDGAPDLRIHAWDGASGGVAMPPLPWRDGDSGPLGEIQVAAEGSVRVVVDPRCGAVTVADLDRGRAFFQHRDAALLPWWERAAPLRPAMHWLLSGDSARLVHAGALGIEGDGALIGGRSGSGKSTVSAAGALAGLEFAGDDFVFVSPGSPPHAHSLHGTIKLDERAVSLLPDLSGATVHQASGPDEKLVVDASMLPGARTVGTLRLVALVVPRADAPPGWRPASGADALRALGPSTLFQLPGTRDRQTLAALAELARTVPAFEVSLAEGPQAAADAVREVIEHAR